MAEPSDSARQLAVWADGVLERVDAQEDLDRRLSAALGRTPDLGEETLARMAEAVRAAACGLGPAGCALAAGVSERLLTGWEEREPAFAAAMSAARRLGRTRAHLVRGAPPALTPYTLRVLLKGVREGVPNASVAALVGLSVRALYRVRRERPEVAALLLAARRARPRKGERRYRLVRVGDGPPEK
ncbi:hypothetical protein [Streptomyces sp. NPDC057877]|uniref:hypothetical protein n=1 Tax=Streptomyces sp. NPDC057877 TaxID=3346269 RepID=UPI0036AB9688